MIAKRADLLQFWSLDKAKAGEYRANSIVFYQKTPDDAGYAYIGKNPYVETNQPPDENKDNWTIDYSFAVPWKSNGKYSINSRVYYFNGSNSYVYKPTVRYFGGTQPPNEEVDEDGIRTWELEMSYRYGAYGNDNFYLRDSPDCEILIPVKKYGGYVVGKSPTTYFNTYPEERLEYFAYTDSQDNIIDNGHIISYLEEQGLLDNNFSEINSIYQTNPYDTKTYIFLKYGGGEPKPLRRGIHRATWYKEQFYYANPTANPYYTYAKSQYQHTLGAYSFSSYIDAHGFSIEMWPNISESDYEFVATQGLSELVANQGLNGEEPYQGLNVLGPFPDGRPTVSFEGILASGYGTIFNGLIQDPSGNVIQEETEGDYFFIFDAQFRRTNNAFDERKGTVFLLKEDYVHTYDEYPMYEIDENGDYVYVGIGYTKSERPREVSIITEASDSKESGFEQPPRQFISADLLSITKSIELGNAVDFKSHQKKNTTTTITSCGWTID
jgi:hypothetical protein